MLTHRPLLLAAALSLSLTAARAIDQTWNTGGPSNDWNAADTNWDAGVAWTQSNSAIFGGTGETVTLTTGITADDLTFNSGGYTVTGNTLTLAGTPTVAVTSSSDTATVSSLLIGSSGLTKAGAGTLTLTSMNTYSGGTTVDAGTLRLGAGGGSGVIRGALTVNAGATVIAGGGSSLGFNSGVQVTTLTLNGGAFRNEPINNIVGLQTQVVLTGASMMGATGSRFDFGAGFGITSNASSTVSTISGGSIMIRNASNLSITVTQGAAASGIDLDISSAIMEDHTGAGSFTKNGLGTLLLRGASTYKGTSTIAAGTLVTGNTAALSVGAVAVNGGGTLQIGDGTVKTVTLAAAKDLVIAAGGTLKLDATLGTATPAITLSGGGKYTFNGTLDLSGVFDTAAKGDYTLITGGTGNIDTKVNIIGFNNGTLVASFANGILTVPEPSTYGLLGAGSLALLAMIRRRKSV